MPGNGLRPPTLINGVWTRVKIDHHGTLYGQCSALPSLIPTDTEAGPCSSPVALPSPLPNQIRTRVRFQGLQVVLELEMADLPRGSKEELASRMAEQEKAAKERVHSGWDWKRGEQAD